MQMTQLVCLGISHQTANVELRECFSNINFTTQRDPAIRELAVLSTCNRVELYAYMDEAVQDSQARLIALLMHVHNMPPQRLMDNAYFHTGEAVVTHLCRVAAGLESLVLGEPQILGQVNNALLAAQQAHASGPVLGLLFRTALQVGKRARTETAISTNAASVSSVALALAQTVAGELKQRRVLVVGLGEIGQLTVKLLRSHGVQQPSLINRTRAKAEALATTWGGQVFDLADLPLALQQADVIFTAASSTTPLIDAMMVEQAMRQREGVPLVIVDLAVPRNVASAVGSLPNVHLFGVDELRTSLDTAIGARQREIPRVEAMIAEEVLVWTQRFQELTVTPLIADIRQRAEAIRTRELARTLRFLGPVDAETVDHLHHFSQALVKQLLHEPTVRLKQKATHGAGEEYADLVRDLFGLSNADS